MQLQGCCLVIHGEDRKGGRGERERQGWRTCSVNSKAQLVLAGWVQGLKRPFQGQSSSTSPTRGSHERCVFILLSRKESTASAPPGISNYICCWIKKVCDGEKSKKEILFFSLHGAQWSPAMSSVCRLLVRSVNLGQNVQV